ncbi:hypothetical protein LMIY3S_01797 [Labrys miyagiensis]
MTQEEIAGIQPMLDHLRYAAEVLGRPGLAQTADNFEIVCIQFFAEPAQISVYEFAPVANAMAAAWEEVTGKPQGGPFLITEYQRMRMIVLERRRARELEKASRPDFLPLLERMKAWALEHRHEAMAAHAERLQEALDAFFREEPRMNVVQFCGVFNSATGLWQACTGEDQGEPWTPDGFYRLRKAALERRRPAEGAGVQ